MNARASITVRGLTVPARDDGDGYELKHGNVIVRAFKTRTPVVPGKIWIGSVHIETDDEVGLLLVHFQAESAFTAAEALDLAIRDYDRAMHYLGSIGELRDPSPVPLPFEPGPRADHDMSPTGASYFRS
jgi:hypothetical protein